MKPYKRLFHSKYFWIALAILIGGIVLNQISSVYLITKYQGKLPILDDLILNRLPLINIGWLYDIVSLMNFALILFYMIKEDFDNIPYFFLLFGLINVVRGIFIVLTPMNLPDPEMLGLFKGAMFRIGTYPSGHTGSAFLSFLLTKGGYKIIFFIFILITVISLLFARGHYSIDIFSAFIFVYAVYSFGKKHLKQKFTIKNEN